VAGERHGLGVLKFADDTEYAGAWVAGAPDGAGVETYRDGSWYAGGFENDKRHGIGGYWAVDGFVYMGQWQRGVRHGVGVVGHTDEVRPPPRTKWTRRVPHPVLIGHGASLALTRCACAPSWSTTSCCASRTCSETRARLRSASMALAQKLSLLVWRLKTPPSRSASTAPATAPCSLPGCRSVTAPPSHPRTKWTRRVPHPVLIGHVPHPVVTISNNGGMTPPPLPSPYATRLHSHRHRPARTSEAGALQT
jgi:hypothetical protein